MASTAPTGPKGGNKPKHVIICKEHIQPLISKYKMKVFRDILIDLPMSPGKTQQPLLRI